MPDGPDTRTNTGPVSGRFITRGPDGGRDHDPIEAYLGIPYAAPAVGDGRWRAPLPAEAWTDVLECRRPGTGAARGRV